MCGIAGYFDPTASTPAERLADEARRMADALAHRGPDDAGVFVDEDAGIALSHRRLAVLDLSAEGHQPMRSADGRFVLAYNGEVYNFRDLAAKLPGAPLALRGHSDTEVLLCALERLGLPAALERLEGMFAFALWDRAERRLHLVTDRFGKKPLYYGWCDHRLYFGSELKALRAHPRFRADVDREALAHYLRDGYVLAPRSIFRGIHKLPPGSYVTLSEARRDEGPTSWWSAEEAFSAAQQAPRLRGAEAAHGLEEALRASVARRLVADVPVGAFLSGGLDSAAVVALMRRCHEGPVRSFTIGFAEAAYDESAAARAIARALGTEHTELQLRPDDALAVIPALPSLYDEPFGDPSAIPTYLVARLARSEVTVCLSGDGADELLGGYERYLWASRIWQAARLLPTGLRRQLAGSLSKLPWDLPLAPLRRLASPRWARRLDGGRVQKLLDVASRPSLDALYASLLGAFGDENGLVKGAPLLPPRRLPTLPASDVERMQLFDVQSYLPGDVLTKVDRASMALGLEVRAPFLDTEVASLCFRLAPAEKLPDDGPGPGKRALRALLGRHLPPPLIAKQKRGFGVPIDAWLRGPLRAWAEELLDDKKLREQGYLEPAPIRAAWHAHQRGERNFADALWAALMFQAWLESRGERR